MAGCISPNSTLRGGASRYLMGRIELAGRSGYGSVMAVPTVFVDAENVRRSAWPNVGRSDLVELCCAWARAHGMHAVVVFDGPAPELGPGEHVLDEHCTVVGTAGESADEWILRTTPDAAPFWLVTSDRALRERAGEGADRTIGGGAFLKELRTLR
jgi:hypothetical protein